MKVLFFAPHSAVWIHAFPEALVAEALALEGHEVSYVGCGGLLNSHCVAMSACGVPFEASKAKKDRICILCRGNERVVRTQLGLVGQDLVDMVNREDIEYVDAMVGSVTPPTCSDLVVEGVEVGRIALYELLIQNKKSALEFSAAEWRRYQASLKNAIVVLRIGQRLLREIAPDRVLVYNALYSVNRVICRLAETRGIPQYFLHAGDNLANRLQRLTLARQHAFAYYRHLRDKWSEFRDVPGYVPAIKSATNHFIELIKGRSVWAYSAAPRKTPNLRQTLRIDPQRKIICATMSSRDEIFAGEITGVLEPSPKLLYANQVDWIKALICYVANRNDLALIIRVHPREFPNKREGVLSEHARTLQEILRNLPNNVRINWPTDGVSLYDLANITDVFANAWSSAGKEMAWLGLPVVLYSNDLTLYPAELNFVGTTELEYFQKIEQALRVGWSPERIRKTYRWCALEYEGAAIDISESYVRQENHSVFSRSVSKALRMVGLYHEQNRDCRNRASRLSSSTQISRVLTEKLDSVVDLRACFASTTDTEEADALRQEVGRLVRALYGADRETQQDSLASRLRHFADS